MQFLLRSLTIFFGTLIAAALVALGEPATAQLEFAVDALPDYQSVVALLGSSD